MSDVWTSAGVIAGVALVAATGWLILDPLIAIAVAAHIVWTGVMLMRRSFSGLLDAAIPEEEVAEIEKIFTEYRKRYGVDFHALRTRQAGARRFINFHLLVPDAWTVAQAHQLSEEIEARIRSLVENAILLTHIEPISEPASYDDIKLERP
jgi:cation diffusion facilitator family transporter